MTHPRFITRQVIFTLLTILVSCTKNQDNPEKSQINARYSVECSTNAFKLRFERNGTTYMVGEIIGSGEMGQVYTILHPHNKIDRWAKAHVLKAIESNSKQDALKAGLNEQRLYEEFGDSLVVKTKYIGTALVHDGFQNPLNLSFLIKRRIEGFTLYELNNRFDQLVKSPAEARKLLTHFSDFKNRLATKMEKISRTKDLYMVDLHAKNIMWDHTKHRWFIVDGLLKENRQKFTSFLDATKAYFDDSTLTTASNGQLDKAFFLNVIDSYQGTKKITQSLSEKADDLEFTTGF